MAVNQEIALQSMDPRLRTGRTTHPLGSSTLVGVDDEKKRESAPVHGIGVTRDWQLESTKGMP